jgi:hypothetical protein
MTSNNKKLHRKKGLNKVQPSTYNPIPTITDDMFYVYHILMSSPIFEGPEDVCRVFVMKCSTEFRSNLVIIDQGEKNMLHLMTKTVREKYFSTLKDRALK